MPKIIDRQPGIAASSPAFRRCARCRHLAEHNDGRQQPFELDVIDPDRQNVLVASLLPRPRLRAAGLVDRPLAIAVLLRNKNDAVAGSFLSPCKGEIPRDTDSPLEEAGFELVVPPSFRSWPGVPRDDLYQHGESPSHLEGDRRFESGFLLRRVGCELDFLDHGWRRNSFSSLGKPIAAGGERRLIKSSPYNPDRSVGPAQLYVLASALSMVAYRLARRSLGNRSQYRAEPEVRIHFPPARSLLQT